MAFTWPKHKKTGVRKVRATGMGLGMEIVFILTNVEKNRGSQTIGSKHHPTDNLSSKRRG